MTEKDRQVEFELDNRVVEIESGEKGIITRLCVDKGAVYVRWDKDRSQVMVETNTLNKERR